VPKGTIEEGGVMERKDRIDGFGALALIGFATVLAFNQVVVKHGTAGLQPVFMAGLRSLGSFCVLLAWMRWRGIAVSLPRATLAPGFLMGGLFAAEFLLLFWALDHTTVARASILFYSMPVMTAMAAHFLLPGERLTLIRGIGLVLAMAGVVLVLARPGPGEASWQGDVAALVGAMGWTGIALLVRVSALAGVRAEMQLWWQLSVSSVLLLALSPLFGPFIRELTAVHLIGLAYQILAVASFGFLFWFWLMKRYPASMVASFSFLSPVLASVLGWVVLAEALRLSTGIALVLVAVGIVLINRRRAP